MTRIGRKEFLSIIHGRAVIAFLSSWCISCKRVYRVLKKTGAYIVDIEQEPLLAEAFRVLGVPVIVCFQNGKEIYRRNGVCSRKQISEILKIKMPDG